MIVADIRDLEWKEGLEALAMMKLDGDSVYLGGRMTDTIVGTLFRMNVEFSSKLPLGPSRMFQFTCGQNKRSPTQWRPNMKVEKSLLFSRYLLK
jgi:hypothetical protein